MTRIFDFTVAGVITIIAVVVHLMGIELFAPGTPLYELATDGTGALDGQARADLWYEIISLWIPLLAVAGIWAWAFVREYRRGVATAAQRAP